MHRAIVGSDELLLDALMFSPTRACQSALSVYFLIGKEQSSEKCGVIKRIFGFAKVRYRKFRLLNGRLLRPAGGRAKAAQFVRSDDAKARTRQLELLPIVSNCADPHRRLPMTNAGVSLILVLGHNNGNPIPAQPS